MAEMFDHNAHQKIKELEKKLSAFSLQQKPPSGGGGGDEMEHRVTALETRIDTVLPTLATKGDVENVRSDIARWTLQTTLVIIGTMLAAIFGVAQVFKGQQPVATAAPPPVIINNIPPQQQAAPAVQDKRR